ncbi:DUF4400 domain-containing protein [Vibrio gangliei]|uniref:DUF4400 domain-containing protein n=1 Tax=Vibrio gangliei TaxID=2077090 RepID=UPI000D01E274|nr:DUF4400 domain-containing protein [Vibrio gangliei]
MSETKNRTPPVNTQRGDSHEHSTGLIKPVINYIMSLCGLLFGALMVSILIEWIGIFFGWWNEPYEYHSKAVASEYIQLINDDLSATNRDFVLSPSLPLLWLSEFTTKWFGFTLTDAFNLSSGFTTDNLSGSIFKAFLISIAFTTITFIVKVGYFFSSLPLVALLIVQFGADGYVYRIKRIYEGRLSSDWLTVMSQKIIGLGLFSLSLIFFSIPIYVHPVLAVLPVCVVSAIGFRALVINFAKNF